MGVFLMYEGFEVPDGGKTRIFGMPEEVVCAILIWKIFFGHDLLAPNLASLMAASLSSMPKWAWIFWRVKGGMCVLIVVELRLA